MARFLLALIAAFAAGPALAQSPTHTLTAPPLHPPPVAPIDLPADAGPALDAADWQLDLLLGAPFAGRASRRIGASHFWTEAGAGLYLIFPTAFVGVRYETHPYEGKRHQFLIRPGVDAGVGYYAELFGSEGLVGTLTADVDLVWRRRVADGGWTDLGLKLGVILASGSGNHGVVPVAALLYGFSF